MGRVNKKQKAAARRRKQDLIQILTVQRPPPEIQPGDPVPSYTTSEDLVEWIQDLAGSGCGRSIETIEEMMAVGLNFLARLQSDLAANAGPEDAKFLVYLLSLQQQRLFEGIYASEERNALFPIEAFLAHHHIGLYPPEWVLDWLASAFEQYVRAGGKTDIGRLLGTKRERGQTTVFKEHAHIVAEGERMNEIATLTFLGISIIDAATMVHGRLETLRVECPSPDTLAERYTKRGWSKIFAPFKPLFSGMSMEEKKRIVAAYPLHTIPNDLR